MGNAYGTLGEYDRAGRQYAAVAEIRRRHWGDRDPKLGLTQYERAWLLHNKGDYAAAEPMFEEALEILTGALGSDHENVLATMQGLADIRTHLGQLESAEALAKRALAVQRKTLGNDHDDVAATLITLSALYHGLREYLKAEKAAREAVQIRANLFDEHPSKLLAQYELARALVARREFDEATPLAGDVLRHYQAALPVGHRFIAHSQSLLAECFMAGTRYEEAEELLLSSFPVIEGRRGDTQMLRETIRRFIRLYDALGHSPVATRPREHYVAKVAEWRAKLDRSRSDAETP